MLRLLMQLTGVLSGVVCLSRGEQGGQQASSSIRQLLVHTTVYTMFHLASAATSHTGEADPGAEYLFYTAW
jgi:hypothetical protein